LEVCELSHIIKKGDTRKGIQAILSTVTNKIATAVNLTGCSVYFSMSNKINEAVATVLDAATGSVLYAPTNADVNTAGEYNGEFIVVYADGKRETFPNDSYIKITILDNAFGGA